MFGDRYFGERYFGNRFFGPGGVTLPADYYLPRNPTVTLGPPLAPTVTRGAALSPTVTITH